MICSKWAGEVRLSVQHTAGEATVRVGDSGTGIAPDVLPHVFDPFVQAHTSLPRAERGIGIGLTVVLRLTGGAARYSYDWSVTRVCS